MLNSNNIRLHGVSDKNGCYVEVYYKGLLIMWEETINLAITWCKQKGYLN